MVFPDGFVYRDVNLPFARFSERHSAGIHVVSYPDPEYDTYTIGDVAIDFSASVDAMPLSNGRIATVYLVEYVDTPLGATGTGTTAGHYEFEVVITQGLSVLGRTAVQFPTGKVPKDPANGFDWDTTSLSFGFQAAAAGDYVVLGASLFDLSVLSGATPKYWGAQWLLLFDCSDSTPTEADEYLREDSAAPFTSFPPETGVEIILSSLDDSRVLVAMLNPESSADPGPYAIFPIDVSGGTLNFQDNGYPGTTGSHDFTLDFSVRLGYRVDDVGLYVGNEQPDEISYGFHVNASGDSISFGSDVHSWDHDGGTYYAWGNSGHNVPSPTEPGVFYIPVYRLPVLDDDGNPMYTAKVQYNGSGDVELLDVSPPLPHEAFDSRIQWAGSPWGYWGCIEHNGKVITAAPASYFDVATSNFQEDLWLIDDTFGACNVYRVANISGASGTTADTGFEVALIESGGAVYAAMNVVDMFDSEAMASDEEFATAMVIAIVNFNYPDIDGGLTEQRRKFWRNRPGW